MAVVLGINAYHAGAAAAVLVDGRPVAAIAEERLNRVKYYARFPAGAIRQCLEIAGLSFSDLDAVAVGRDPSANRSQKIAYALRHPKRLLNFVKLRRSRSALDDLKAQIARECDTDPEKLRFQQYDVEHHLAHTASAYFISDWERAAGWTLDGSGDFVTCMMTRCEGSQITPVRRIFIPHSLGSLYTMICEFIGYSKYGDEGKVMGLAPLGSDTYHEEFDRMVELTNGGFRLDLDYFLPLGSHGGLQISDTGEMVLNRHYSDRVVERFGAPRVLHSEITQRDMDLAFGLQRVFEDAYMHLLNILHGLVPEPRIAMAGGCVLNSVANGKLFDRTPFTETCIQPASGDEGLALGAALYVGHSILGESKRYVMRDAYLGQEFSEGAIRSELDSAGVRYERHERPSLLGAVVDELVAGKVVGWFQGRSEWGPRALGNRSILAHPGFPGMKDILNARIKHREAFRPFAPSVLQERQSDLFEHSHPSPFMLHVYKIRPEWRARLSAVNHVDDTGRLQTVAREENPLYYDLIEAFDARTGIPVILNTSFNENEPIVNTPAQAIDCYRRTKMDVLAIGPFVCTKAAQ
jgi:carbamoyltransferase